MLEWLIPLSAFWVVTAMFLGGSPAHIEGGNGPKQLLGLLASFALYLVAWAALRAGLQAVAPAVLGLVLASLVTTALIPVWCRLAFRAVGMRITGPTFSGRRAAHP